MVKLDMSDRYIKFGSALTTLALAVVAYNYWWSKSATKSNQEKEATQKETIMGTVLPPGTPLIQDEIMTDVETEYRIQTTGVELAFAHVVPGEYSEIYASLTGVPGREVKVTLSGPAVIGNRTKIVTINESGQNQLVWRITAYGTYALTGEYLTGNQVDSMKIFSNEIVVN